MPRTDPRPATRRYDYAAILSRLDAGESISSVARDLGMDRRDLRRLVARAKNQALNVS